MSEDWLPELLLFKDSNGVWSDYLERLHQQFIHDFAQKDVLKNKHLQIHNALSEQSITGIAAGIDAQGCLLIEQADGSIQTIWTGTIQVLDSAVSSLQANKHK